MTLVTRVMPPAYHKKVSGKHHKQSKTYHKTYWPYLPLLLIVAVGIILNSTLPGKSAVLGYATDMSVQSLLVDTNNQRQANKESDLTINQQLNAAAQAKAQDMAAKNYWSHNTPDGQTPWSFMVAAGYNYQLAGENLAYGFSTAADTLTGWMNSPEHRANILNAGYKEVGFGFINIVNYQSNGPETLVVAMYGTQPTIYQSVTSTAQSLIPQTAKPTTVTPNTAAAKPPTTTSQPATTPTTTQPAAQTDTAAPAATPAIPTTSNGPSPTQTAVVTPKQVTTSDSKPQAISRLQLISAGKVSVSVGALSIIGSLALIFFLLRHGIAWHKLLVKGEHFVLHHPLLDVTLISLATVMFLLAHQVGFIR